MNLRTAYLALSAVEIIGTAIAIVAAVHSAAPWWLPAVLWGAFILGSLDVALFIAMRGRGRRR